MSQAATPAGEGTGWFSPENLKILRDPFTTNNPVAIQVMGICSALATTNQVRPAIVMGLGVTVVMGICNMLISLMRNVIPPRVRIIVEMVLAASLVIVVDQLLKAFAFDISKQLSVFVSLIITNTLVLARMEAYALWHPPWRAFLDGIGNGLGYSLMIGLVAVARELLGSGTILGYQIIPGAVYTAGYENNGMMVLAPGAFILLALMVWAQRTATGYKET